MRWRLRVASVQRYVSGALCICALSLALIAAQASAQVPGEHASAANTWLGASLLERADTLEAEASELIAQGSLLRKQLKQQQSEFFALNETQKKQQAQKGQNLKAEMAEKAKRSVSLQKEGAAKRKQAAQLREQAVDQFALDMQARWPQWVSTIEPIRLGSQFQNNRPSVGAHNSRTRTVHPRKQELAGSPQTKTANSMTLALPELSGQQLPAGLDTRSFSISRERQFVAHIEVAKQTVASKNGAIELNELHAWNLVLSDINGARIPQANIKFRGHMPGHVHGLPTQPRITQQLDNGVYRISGVKFQMRGWWVIELLVQVEGHADDSIRFNLSL